MQFSLFTKTQSLALQTCKMAKTAMIHRCSEINMAETV